MISIFRKLRKKFLKENRITNYLLYAIGEIALVMIGILLALQVNNWKEKRQQRQQLNTILKTISNDLVRDTITASAIIKFYEDNQKNSLRIINKEITKDNFDECPSCRRLISIYQPFSVQKKGYNLLKNFSDQYNSQSDSLIADISQFYTILPDLIDQSNAFIKDEIFSNIESFKKQPWFIDWTQQKLTDEMIIYFSESEDYRKRVASHNVLAANNHLRFIQAYKQNAETILTKMNEHFDDIKKD